jgi:hypothetical protein
MPHRTPAFLLDPAPPFPGDADRELAGKVFSGAIFIG